MDRYEADDALATGAARWRDQVEQVRILTPDKDLGQAIVGQRVVVVDRLRERVIDEDELLRSRGIRPASVPDWLALVGDSADGYPGLAGFGEKTAATLLRAFGHLEDIPSDPRLWPAGIRQGERLAATLASEMSLALLYRKLATLIDDVPLAETLEDLAWSGVPGTPSRPSAIASSRPPCASDPHGGGAAVIAATRARNVSTLTLPEAARLAPTSYSYITYSGCGAEREDLFRRHDAVAVSRVLVEEELEAGVHARAGSSP